MGGEFALLEEEEMQQEREAKRAGVMKEGGAKQQGATTALHDGEDFKELITHLSTLFQA